MATVEVGGRTMSVANLDKVLWPEIGFTKGHMIDYYVRVAPAMLPHVRRRPVTLRRFPDGVHGINWYETRCPPRPSWLAVATLHMPRSGKTFDVAVVDDVAAVVWAANLAAVELHPYLACVDALDRPRVAVFDLDPGPPADLGDACRVALWLRDAFDALGLASFAKTSGVLGVHVYVPVDGEQTYADTKAFAREIARRLSAEHPERVLDRMPLAARAGKVFVDWSQNDAGKSTVAPYSLRAQPVPTVSTPLSWEEVEQGAARRRLPLFGSDAVLRRLDAHGDLFAAVGEVRQRLPRLA